MERGCSYCMQKYIQGHFSKSSILKFKQYVKSFSTTKLASTNKGTMKAWQIHQYGGNEELTFSNTIRIPKIQDPTDVLVEVHAASVNPIDCRMREGYGSALLNALRNKSILPNSGRELPLILGRDFSGVVVETGKGVKRYKSGDEVWGTIFATRQGTHAEYTVATEKDISPKPVTLSHTDASSIPYVACTTIAALCNVGELNERNTPGKRVLIHGGSGGIGTFAIQLMKAWGADVTTTCSTDAVELVTSLGADVAIDYKTQNVKAELSNMDKFDVILDSFGKEKTGYSMDFLKPFKNSKYVTIRHPFLKNFDSYGVPGGVVKSAADAAYDTVKSLTKGVSHRWAVYVPNGQALERIATMVDNNMIIPVIDKVFPFEDIPAAFKKVDNGHARGKTVVQIVKNIISSTKES